MALLEAACLFTIFGVTLYFWITKNHGYWAIRNIPYESPLPVVGNLIDSITMKKSADQIFADIHKKYAEEKVVGIFIMTRPALLIRDPALITQILTTDFHKFADNDFDISESLDSILSKNLLFQNGERWKSHRQILSPAFTTRRIKSTYDRIEAVAEKLINYLKLNPEPDVKLAMSLYTSEIVASWGLGINGFSFDSPDPKLPKLGKMLFEPGFYTGLKYTLASFLPKLTELLKIRLVPAEITEFFDTMLRDLLKTRRQTNGIYQDYLQYYLDKKKNRSSTHHAKQTEITDDEIVSGVVSFFIEGYETSSSILTLLLYHLVKNPQIQQILQEEVDQLYMGGLDKLSFDIINDLPYLNKVLSETLRLHNALSMAKRCTKTCSLNLGDGKSLIVEKGTEIIVSTLGIHTDPVYWEDSETFDPERFAKTTVRGTYIPFGDGPRICVGVRLANTIIKTATIAIVRNFNLLPNKKTAKKFVQNQNHLFSMLEGGVFFEFAKRT